MTNHPHDKHQHSAASEVLQESRNFLEWLFGPGWRDEVFVAHVVGGRGWQGCSWLGLENELGSLSPDEWGDLYYSVGAFPVGDVTPRRKERVTGVAGLVLDDVGTKGSGKILDKLDKHGAIGAKIETSEGNFHWVIKYADRLTSQRELALHVLLVNALAELGAADRLSDITRLMRLPAGRNTKPGRGDWPVRLTEMRGGAGESLSWLAMTVLAYMPDEGVDLSSEISTSPIDVDKWPDDLWNRVLAYLARETGTKAADLASGPGGLGPDYGYTAYLDAPDPWLKLQMEIASQLGWPAAEPGTTSGTVDCRCPFGDEHSTDDLIRYLGRGNWKCHHSSCGAAGRTNGDYKRELMRIWDEEIREDEDPGAGGLLARWTFEGAGAVGDEELDALGLSGVAAQVAASAGRVADLGVSGVSGVSGGLGGLLDRYVLVTSGPARAPGWWDTRTSRMLSGAQLEAAEDVLAVFEAGVAGKKAARHQMANAADVRVVDELGFEPGISGEYVCEETGARKLSTWVASRVSPVAEKPSVFLEHLDYMAGPSGTPQRDELENFLAWLIQKPREKCSRTVIMVGGQGVGKDLVVDCMAQVLGVHNVRHIRSDDLTSGYNDWQRARLVVVPEANAGQRYDVANALKAITGSGGGWVTINEKWMPKYSARDVAHFVMTTNDIGSVPIDKNSRRDLVVECPDQPHPDGAAYYSSVGPSLTGRGAGGDPKEIGRVLWWLKEKDISAYDPSEPAPMTSAKAHMSRSSHSDSVLAYIEALEDLGFSEDGLASVEDPFVLGSVLRRALVVRCNIRKESARALSKAMEDLGWVCLPDKIVGLDGKQSRVWVLKNTKNDFRNLANSDRQKMISKIAQVSAAIMGTPQQVSAL